MDSSGTIPFEKVQARDRFCTFISESDLCAYTVY